MPEHLFGPEEITDWIFYGMHDAATLPTGEPAADTCWA